MSFVLDPTNSKDKEIWKASSKSRVDYYVRGLYAKNTAALNYFRSSSLKHDVATTASDAEVQKVASAYNAPWHLLPAFSITNVVHRFIMRADVPNYIPPVLRFVIMPVAISCAAIDIIKAYTWTKKAGFDESTARFEAGGRALYQVTNNVLIPYTIFTAVSRAFRLSPLKATATYAGFGLAVATSVATSSCLRNCIETMVINARMRRKDYSGAHQQTLGHLEFKYDNFIDLALAKKYSSEPTDDYLELFPNFMVAETSPAFEVPSEVSEFVGLTPVAVKESIVSDTITNQQGLITRVPAPTPFTYGRESKRFAEYSLASPEELALDERLGLTLPAYPVTTEAADGMIEQVRKLRLAHEQASTKYQH